MRRSFVPKLPIIPMVPLVMPWYAPRKANMVLRPVVCLASFIAASTASAPEGPQNWIAELLANSSGKKALTVLMNLSLALVVISSV